MPTTSRVMPMSITVPSADPAAGEGLGEQAWIEVIQKMDEVYTTCSSTKLPLKKKRCAGGVSPVHRKCTDVDISTF